MNVDHQGTDETLGTPRPLGFPYPLVCSTLVSIIYEIDIMILTSQFEIISFRQKKVMVHGGT